MDSRDIFQNKKQLIVIISLMAIFAGTDIVHAQVSGTINGHDYVDLGLSVKWSTCNVGAQSPSGYGDYYAWGETSTKSTYTEENSKTYEKNIDDIKGNSRYDVARANWGSSWRLPTDDEAEELLNKCKWTWATQGGNNGYKVTGPNGKSIFVPASGNRDGASLYDAGEYGFYWTSTPCGRNADGAYSIDFNSSYHRVSWNSRYAGLSIRPVTK